MIPEIKEYQEQLTEETRKLFLFSSNASFTLENIAISKVMQKEIVRLTRLIARIKRHEVIRMRKLMEQNVT